MIEIIPNWHPVFVHFTVALLSLSVGLYLATYLPLPAGVRAEWRVVAPWMLWLGAMFAIATVATGWLAYNSVDHDDVSHAAMTEHRNWALVTLTVFMVLALWSAWGRWVNRESSKGAVGTIFLALLAVGGFLLASTAWRGAELVFRHGLGVMSLPNTGTSDAGHATGHAPMGTSDTLPAPATPGLPSAHDHNHKH